MRTIRPYQLFSLLDADRTAQVQIPSHRGAGTVTLLETFCLIAAMKSIKAKRIFEFGTFLGASTLNLALNVPEDGRVFTFDLDAESTSSLAQHPSDAPLTAAHLSSVPAYQGSPAKDRITEIRGNSLSFDSTTLHESIDFVFIDGGHDEATATADTRNAFAMRRAGGIIAWHDYGNRDYPELTALLESIGSEVLHVGDTMLCFAGIEQRFSAL